MNKRIEDLLKSHNLWLKRDKLDKVVIRIHKIYLESPQLLTGDILGLFVKRLIDSEVEVGGPYVSKDDLYTNILIMRLFKALGTPLPNLESYLANKSYEPKNKYEEVALKLPIKITAKSSSNVNRGPNKVVRNSRKSIDYLSTSVRSIAVTFLDKIVELDGNEEISLISHYILNSVSKSPTKKEIETSYRFGEANIYAWIAYTIYDDFIDGEGSPKLLSLANVMHRRSYEIYMQESPSLKSLINEHYDSVDNSNLWELQNCRAKIKNKNIFLYTIPDYKERTFLAERAIGHMLGPKILIKNCNLLPIQENLIFEAFNRYLIAKQINDDLEDWKVDLNNGHLSFVVSRLLNSSGLKAGKYNTESLMIKLQHNFWETILEECLQIALDELIISETLITESGVFKDKNLFITNIVNPLKNSVERSIRNHQNDKLFLKTYIT